MKVVSMRGATLDIGVMMTKHANRPALGNAHMNARGDVLDASGNVVRRREQISSDYNQNNAKAVRSVGLKSIAAEVLTPAEAVAQADRARAVAETTAKKSRKITDAS